MAPGAGGCAVAKAGNTGPGRRAAGVGGYHLACSPRDAGAVAALRRIKARERKPFAVMFRDLAAVREVCAVGDREAELPASPARPIVLLDLRDGPGPFDPGVLRGDRRCGAFLPYTALPTCFGGGAATRRGRSRCRTVPPSWRWGAT